MICVYTPGMNRIDMKHNHTTAMKKVLPFIMILCCFAWVVGCDRDEISDTPELPGQGGDKGGVPEGWFVASFDMGGGGVGTRALNPTEGTDSRVQQIRYLVFNASDGSFVHERNIWLPEQDDPTWPFSGIRDTLPAGDYTAVFLGNVHEDMFTFAEEFDVLTGYESGYSNARIWLPPIEFTAESEYYMGKAEFSQANPSPEVWLQRIVSRLEIYRNAVDTNYAVSMLVDNIVDNLLAGDLLTNTVKGVLAAPIKALLVDAFGEVPIIGGHSETQANLVLSLVGGLDGAVNLLTGELVGPILDALRPLLVDYLLNNVEDLLEANGSGGASVLEPLTVVLNPWGTLNDGSVAITMADYPQAIDFDGNVVDVFEGEQQFIFALDVSSVFSQRSVSVAGLAPDGVYDIKEVNVLSDATLPVTGVVVDGLLDNTFLLNDEIVDISDPLSEALGIENIELDVNEWIGADYSLVNLALKSYEPQEEPSTTIDLSLAGLLNADSLTENLEKIPVLGLLIAGLDGVVLDPLLNTLLDMELEVPIQLPLVGIDNLDLSGSWSIEEGLGMPETPQE